MATLIASLSSFLGTKHAMAEETAPKLPETPFEYPLAPDTLSTLEARTGYVMTHFWDKADMKKVMADTAKFHKAFSDFVGFIPYSRMDSVKKAITSFTGRFASDPKAVTKIAAEAERTLFGPEADFWSEDCYLMFLRPLLSNKKIKPAQKERYLKQIQMLNASQPGANMISFDYTTRHGATHSLYDNKAEYIVVLFQPEDCSDCSMTRLRLNADAATTKLVKNGTVKIVLINPSQPSPTWRADMEGYPYEWEIGSAPTVDEKVDIRVLPNIYLLDKDYHILAKRLDLNQLLALMATINQHQVLAPQPAEDTSANHNE